jgi:hypothetical protein
MEDNVRGTMNVIPGGRSSEAGANKTKEG